MKLKVAGLSHMRICQKKFPIGSVNMLKYSHQHFPKFNKCWLSAPPESGRHSLRLRLKAIESAGDLRDVAGAEAKLNAAGDKAARTLEGAT